MPQCIYKWIILHANIGPFCLFCRWHTFDIVGWHHTLYRQIHCKITWTFFSLWISTCRNNPGTSKVTTSLPPCVLSTRVANNTSSDTSGDATVSPYFSYLHCLLPSAHVLPLIRPYIFYIIKLTSSRFLVLLFSSVNNVGSIGWTTSFPGIAPLSNWLNYLMMSTTYFSTKILMPQFPSICVNITTTALF